MSDYTAKFKPYLKSNRPTPVLGLVYAYVDIGVRFLIPTGDRKFKLDHVIVEAERALKTILGQAEQRARENLGSHKYDLPQFRFIGLMELLGVLNNLIDVDHSLLTHLRGQQGSGFTYDSPKFVEAVIRLARGDIPRLAANPIIRVDDDVSVSRTSIEKIVDTALTVSREDPYYFFSGKYGRTDGTHDIVNDFAVRTHWFFPSGTQPGDKRYTAPDRDFKKSLEQSRYFLEDLSVLGATQYPLSSGKRLLTSRARKLINNRRLPCIERRPAAQVVSGAGLVMGRRNVALLPPFMNFDNLIVWVDDHLKRRLHEKLNDMVTDDPESVSGAFFQQERHLPHISSEENENSSTGWYFRRLLEGCILHAIIEDDGSSCWATRKSQTTYAKTVQDIVWFKIPTLQIRHRLYLQRRLQKVALKRAKTALHCWSSEEYRDSYSWEWSGKQLGNEVEIQRLCGDVVSDAMHYIDLLEKWHIFTRAIERMKLLGNGWLAEPVE